MSRDASALSDDDHPERTDPDLAPLGHDGRPLEEDVLLWIDDDLLERFRSSGPDWQARINAALRKAVGLDPR